MKEQDASKLTRDEFLARFRMATAFYDNYLRRPGPKRSNEFYAETALLKAGLLLTRSKGYVIQEFISICTRGVSVEKMEDAINHSWTFYCLHE